MSSTLWNPVPSPIFDSAGRFAAYANAYFYVGSTGGTPLTTYARYDLAQPHTHPVVANAVGIFPNIYLPYGDYAVRVESASGEVLIDASYIANNAPFQAEEASSVQLFSTGEILWRLRSDVVTGWVRLNGRTIGSPSSGATERAADDCFNLYDFMWSRLDDAVAAVTGGRGASASADWLAGKPIKLIDMRGRAAIGMDDGGVGSSANVIQVSTTVNVTNGLATCTVGSAANLGIGMYVKIAGVASGTITDITSGTTVTLSAPYVGTTGSGKAFTASYFQEPAKLGYAAGTTNVAMTIKELAAHTHTFAGASPGVAAAGGGVAAGQFGGTTGSTGGGLPLRTLSPSVIGCWYIKL